MIKPYQKKDPYREREAYLYEHPVASREFIIQYLKEINRPVSFKHLVQTFNLKRTEEKEGLSRRLIAMKRDGQLINNRKGNYALVTEMELVRGRVQAHHDGFGFLIPDDGSSDIFLPGREMRMVFTDDIVLVRITNFQECKKREGAIIEVLERNTHQVVGRYVEDGGLAFVDPNNQLIVQDILIPPGQENKAKLGQFVVAEIIVQPTKRRQPMGRVVEILGDHLTPGLEVKLAIRAYELPHRWPTTVLRESQAFPVEISRHDKDGRKDLRSLPFITIDGEDAKDFDDAVYCKSNSDGWELYVAVADVSHYVKIESAIDQEARLRGNSVYFPMQVIPMLPEILSNGLCSLKPHKDRLSIVCEIHVTKRGHVNHYQFYEAIICSQARLTYNQAAAMLRGTKTRNQEIPSHIKNLHKLYQKLLKQRIARGAIEFCTKETRIEFDKKGKIKRILPVARNEAHRIIEECMLLANVLASHFLQKKNIPTLYRVHECPDEQKLHDLKQFLRSFGLRLTGGDKPTPMDYTKLLLRIEKRSDAHLLQMVMLRSLRQAIYSPENVGHFGLSYEHYCHFTSPIRRYPDLVVHRGIRHLLKRSLKKFYYEEKILMGLGEHCSMTERRADRATRDAIDWLKCEYMLNKVGRTFDGHIVDVTGFGVFVELDNIYVEGLVHITALENDYYHYDPVYHLLRGKRSGLLYRLGDSIRVIVARVNLDNRKIDFVLKSG
ncbi:ribonuclease R [Coxiella endosymbiont of Amblyomma nuttalli]|uniref:ribonuclease R n=1 Tax=Coxiella endosymbiont of Amblyomma nuttalli TaxID=2749996 RepID=UPI001BAADE15|nr:ribonuclease R [Coxiella endosymbiont of Amblyomma nuttalli]QTS83942.1 Ribonuclease R [Coxiella endosymbiont of Amblyomma nuttalli]